MAVGCEQRCSKAGRAPARLAALAFAAAFALVTLSAAFVSEAFAQERQQRRWFQPLRQLRELFVPRRYYYAPQRPVRQREAERPRVRKTKSQQQQQPKKQRTAPREPEVLVKEKAPDAKIVLVIGDFLGSGLAEGLSQAYSENENVTVIDRTRGSSGFVRQDVYDWPAEIAGVVAAEKPAVVVVMLGSNDRQQMRIGEAREPLGSEAWTKEYDRRATALASKLSEGKTPFVWLGLPAFKSSKMSDDILVFNEVYRAAVTSVKGQFVDIWDGFVDESGAYASTGPDINGQPVRLRANDGINFTQAGKRKLAFYAEKPIAKILGLSPTGALPGGPALPDAAIDPLAPMPVDRTVPISLDDPELDGGTELLGALPASARSKAADEAATLSGMSDKPTPGRADAFSWPPQAVSPPAPTAAAAQPVAEDQETAASGPSGTSGPATR
ncbi:DUF459 domain-containing protein [Arvimicrobium flavum]|uniref:SGNH/GDSL hydrolase family protein n=1 Tax=Arvimicrobium flavum TaxID=3393320 RepID=UPI00237B5A02|nr:DUF459 domain-containing protein [Mesorhizobium shangrilense]